jgi:outer membrane protein TolC
MIGSWCSTRPRAALALAALLAAAPPALAQQPGARPPAAGPLRITLGGAARLAARQSAPALNGALQTAQARARVRQRRGDLLPNVRALAGDNRRTFNTAALGIDFPAPAGQQPIFDPRGEVLGPVDVIDLRARVAQPLLDLAAFRRVRTARADASAAEALGQSASEQAATGAAAAYLRVLRADALLEARGADSALAEELLAIARAQLQAGTGVGLDVTRAQSQSAQLRAELLAARNERDRARLDLRRALGLPPDAEVDPTDSLARLALADTAADEAALTARALRSRPDLRAAARQRDAAEQETAAIRAERLPSLGVVADQGVTGKSTSRLLSTYAVGVQLSVPVFDGLRREARIEEQTAVAREADVRQRDLELQAATDVRGALLDLASAREQVAATRERLRLGEQELTQARERFQAGVAGNADAVTASLALTGARTLLIDALTAYQSARISLARATGSVTELP